MRFLVLPAALLMSVAAAQPPPPKPPDVARLVEQLGSEEFDEREAATKRLEELGAAAIEELKAGAKSENAEIARRAQELLRKAERRLANEKALAPTLVELDLKDKRLDDVLAELSKQANCDVVLGGVKPAELAHKKVSVSTGGKVPFWEAVLKVCDKADVQIAGVAGFYAPGSMPLAATRPPATPGSLVPPVGPPPRGGRPLPASDLLGNNPDAPYRRTANANSAVVLEARDTPRRPSAVYGAVLVESPQLPKTATPDQPSALLQVWPEPRLQWQSTSGVKVTGATDATGARLAAEYIPPGELPRTGSGDAVLVRNPDGTAKLIRDPGGPFSLPGAFRPNPRQAVVRFKPGDKPPAATANFDASLIGTVRSGIEPLSKATKLEADKAATGTGVNGVEMSVTYRAGPNGRYAATVELVYDPNAVAPAGAGDDLPGINGATAGLGNNCVFGVRVTDDAGKPYALGLTGGDNRVEPGGRKATMRLTLELHPDKDGSGAPAAVTFWGTYSRPVEVPVKLMGVALSGGK